MKWLTTLAAVLAVAFLATSVTMAEEGKKEKKERPPAAAWGEVVSVSDTEVVLKNKQGEVHVKVNASTKVKVNGKEGKLSDIKPGMKATVPTLENGVAQSIHAHTRGEGDGKGKDMEKRKEKPKE